MSARVNGIHHVTSGVAGAQEDIDFFTKVVGQRMIKQTVLFDGEKPIYHLYYANKNAQGYPRLGNALRRAALTACVRGRVGRTHGEQRERDDARRDQQCDEGKKPPDQESDHCRKSGADPRCTGVSPTLPPPLLSERDLRYCCLTPMVFRSTVAKIVDTPAF